MEKIVSPAVKLTDGTILRGRSHSNIVVENSFKGGEKITDEMKGFVTSHDRFVDRKEAGKIAFEAGQISDPTNYLISYDIKY